ncbi:MAG: hypothetical protein FWF43_01625 [Propionibacteriaceae bacterium]|nr:hypothetical protein [Propionibacteriaceae bacterium]
MTRAIGRGDRVGSSLVVGLTSGTGIETGVGKQAKKRLAARVIGQGIRVETALEMVGQIGGAGIVGIKRGMIGLVDRDIGQENHVGTPL